MPSPNQFGVTTHTTSADGELPPGETWVSEPIDSGHGSLSVALTSSQPGILLVQRYADMVCQAPVGEELAVGLLGGKPGWIVASDGFPHLAFRVRVTNAGREPATLSGLHILTGLS